MLHRIVFIWSIQSADYLQDGGFSRVEINRTGIPSNRAQGILLESEKMSTTRPLLTGQSSQATPPNGERGVLLTCPAL
jgi:hypothetical protein